MSQPSLERPIEELLELRCIKGAQSKKKLGDPDYRPPKVYERKSDSGLPRQIHSFKLPDGVTSRPMPADDIPAYSCAVAPPTIYCAPVRDTTVKGAVGNVYLSHDAAKAVRRAAFRSNEAILMEMQRPIIRDSPWLDFATSTVAVDYRLLKLKMELFNILAILPLHRVNWPGYSPSQAALSRSGFCEGSIVKTPYGRGEVKAIRADGMLVIQVNKRRRH